MALAHLGTGLHAARFRRGPRTGLAVLVLLAGASGGVLTLPGGDRQAAARAQDRPGDTDPPAEDEPAADDAAEGQGGVALPTDRLKERQLDRIRRLVADGRWSDSATLVDEILGGDLDYFFRPRAGESTWRSIKSETGRIVGEFPDDGRRAYELQFRARADRALEEAIRSGDDGGVVAVARRWFHTPAGRRATFLAALDALDHGRPLEAAAWLERLATVPDHAEFEPTLSLVRAVAWWRAGERRAATETLDRLRATKPGPVRMAGRDVPLDYPPGGAAEWLERVAGAADTGPGRSASEWRLHRGDPARNALVEASRPLLVPRFRVPLTRHPEEGRLLERRRRLFADRDMPILPAGTPLAVEGMILVHSPLGLLAVDFETGKRVWMQTAGAAGSFFEAGAQGGDDGEDDDADARAAIRGVFDDATSGTLSSDGRLVFAVESDPAALAGSSGGGIEMFRQPSPPRAANVLSAYRVADRGTLAWRLNGTRAGGEEPLDPQRQQPFAPVAPPAGAWYLGAPLPVGDQLFVLVEERGEIRLDVVAAADGALRWSQPLAELDEGMAIGSRESHLRRVAGLSPSFSDGVLVCPTGAGTVVAVDLATRTLLWAYTFARPNESDTVVLPNGVRVQRGGMGAGGMIINGRFVALGSGPSPTSGWRDGSPIVAGGRIILTPRESDELHCVDLRSGAVLWKQPRRDGLYVAGVVDGRVIVVGRRGVESLSVADGTSTWNAATPLDGACPSGRGVITGGRLFLPLDTPEVAEIDLADGSVAGRSRGRGGQVAGNLVAYRGEVVSQGVGALEVYHQSAEIGERVETALRERPGDPWARLWAGQIDLDRGAVAAGVEGVIAAREAAPDAVPDALVRDALVTGLERDFAAALPAWERWSARTGDADRATLRLVVDGTLRGGDAAAAWRIFVRFLDGQAPAPRAGDDRLVADPADPGLSLTESAWIAGRFRRFLEVATPAIRAEIDARCDEALAAAAAIRPAVERSDALTRLHAWFGPHPAGVRAGEILRGALADAVTASGPGSDAGRDIALRGDLLAGPAAAAVDRDPAADPEFAWPFGRVVERRNNARGNADDANRMVRLVSIPLEGAEAATFPGLKLAYDVQQPAIVAVDDLGRRIGEPLSLEAQGRGDVVAGFQPFAAEASVVGRIVVVRSGATLVGCELSAVPGQRHRRLWAHSEQTGGTPEMAMPFMGRVVGDRHARLDNVPLGMEVSEPDEVAPVVPVQVGQVRATGLPVLVSAAGQRDAGIAAVGQLQLRDPVSGAIRWERRRLPASGELVGDDDYVVVLPASGVQAVVVSMRDGSVVRTVDLPRRGRRLLTVGRRIVVIGAAEGDAQPRAAGAPVRLTLLDPATMESRALGEFPPEALVSRAGGDALAVVEPTGAITVVDLVTGATRFRTKLVDMPAGLEQLRVSVWQDRLLVLVGRRESPEERALMDKVGMITALPQQFAREMVQPMTGSLWAVDRTDGAMLWSVPATILRHCLHPGQAEGMPVLLFARQIQRPGAADRQRMGILCIDKRTGQALCVDDKIGGQGQFIAGCDMVGDPDAHTVTVGRGGVEGGDVVLEFTGAPTAPRPPFQAASRQPVSRDVLSELEHWLETVIQLPIPF
ncbi:MAG: PQQ-binding-like beta-propeller repeat protein [Planctomycetaceae bacterium]